MAPDGYSTDLLFQHKMRQREQSTWAWTEHTPEDVQEPKEGGACVDDSKLSSSVDDVSSSAKCGAAATCNHQQQQQVSDQEQMRSSRRNRQQCCCETLENALVTIDILRSKLVSPTINYHYSGVTKNSQNVLEYAVLYSCLKKLELYEHALAVLLLLVYSAKAMYLFPENAIRGLEGDGGTELKPNVQKTRRPNTLLIQYGTASFC